MPTYVVKPDRARDFYVLWSEVVDAPIWWGSRREMARHLLKRQMGPIDAEAPAADAVSCAARAEIERRLDRADKYGSSFRNFYAWHVGSFVVREGLPQCSAWAEHTLRRADLEYLCVLLQDDRVDEAHLLVCEKARRA